MADRKSTPRGFALWEIDNQDYTDTPPYKLYVQASSLATEDKVWVGVVRDQYDRDYMQGDRMHLSKQAARELRDALTEWLNEHP